MPELPTPTTEIVDALAGVKDPASGKWIIALEHYYQKQDLCRIDPGCILIPSK